MNPTTADPRPTRILEAAARLIAYYGYDKTTMEEIARAAGVSKGALYLVWPGKQALFDALLAREMQRLLADLRQRVEQDPLGGQIAALYRHTLLALRNNPLMSALYTHDARILGEFVHRQEIERYSSRLLLGKDAIRKMQAAGLLRSDLSAEAITYLFSVIALGFMSIGALLPAGEIPPLDEASGALTALVERGLAAPGGDSAAGKQASLSMIDWMVRQMDESA